MTVAEFIGAKSKEVLLNCIDTILSDPRQTKTSTGFNYWSNSKSYIEDIYDHPSFESLSERQRWWIEQICLNLYNSYDKSIFIDNRWYIDFDKLEPISDEFLKSIQSNKG